MAAMVALTMSCSLLGCDSRLAVPRAVIASQPSDPARLPASIPAATQAEFSTSGPLVAEQQADIAAQRDGRVVKVAVDIGDRVQ